MARNNETEDRGMFIRMRELLGDAVRDYVERTLLQSARKANPEYDAAAAAAEAIDSLILRKISRINHLLRQHHLSRLGVVDNPEGFWIERTHSSIVFSIAARFNWEVLPSNADPYISEFIQCAEDVISEDGENEITFMKAEDGFDGELTMDIDEGTNQGSLVIEFTMMKPGFDLHSDESASAPRSIENMMNEGLFDKLANWVLGDSRNRKTRDEDYEDDDDEDDDDSTPRRFVPVTSNSVSLDNGRRYPTVATISDGEARYDICEDEGCYVIYKNRRSRDCARIFPELLKTLKSLPDLPVK